MTVQKLEKPFNNSPLTLGLSANTFSNILHTQDTVYFLIIICSTLFLPSVLQTHRLSFHFSNSNMPLFISVPLDRLCQVSSSLPSFHKFPFSSPHPPPFTWPLPLIFYSPSKKLTPHISLHWSSPLFLQTRSGYPVIFSRSTKIFIFYSTYNLRLNNSIAKIKIAGNQGLCFILLCSFYSQW